MEASIDEEREWEAFRVLSVVPLVAISPRVPYYLLQ